MPDKITWTNETRKLSELVPWEHNPKQLTEKQGQHLQKSIRKFGLVHALAISPDGLIYDGNSRDKLLLIMDEYGGDAEIDVRVSSRPLTQDEHDELIVRLKENTGEWDWDMVPNMYDVGELVEFGMPEWKLDMMNGPMIPEPKKQEEPHLDSDHFVEIYCSVSALADMNGTLNEWGRMQDVTVNIS